ncbi:hypothetical protein Goari_019277 [Gossypium aridum]|uniref:DUF4283 domain-containing protein n=1 Tax=Gossypium aridum TaxID=34290 RepID=A0A7J8WS76_GOSAI|nr:hypothetical protein [Gossypium aridum]
MVLVGNLSLICSVWTKKSYNPDIFKVQLRSIWNMTRKFEIKVVGQNLFLIPFGSEEDLDGIIEVENPSILEIAVNYQNLRDLVPPSLPKIFEDTFGGELSKELIEDDMQGK